MNEKAEEEQKTPPAPSPTEPVVKEPAKNSRSHTLLWVTVVFLVAGIAWFCYWFFYLKYYQYTDDAYANGNMVNINTAVSGSVIAFYADDTDLVTEGQLLIQLDSTNYQIQYEKELATLASTVLQVKQLYDTVHANAALVENKRTLLSKAQYDYDNRSKLVDSLAVSNEDFIHAKDNLLVAELELKQAIYQYNVSKDSAGITPPPNHPLIEQQKGNVRSAYYKLQHCSIYAPSTGYVALRNVEVGQWAIPERNLMAIIPTDYVWVDANFKETQLGYMRIGQPATVWFDIYGSKVQFKGKVLGIASGSGSVFSLIPPQNATGNWIKIVQRLPVRISLDPETLKNYPTRLGISAEVNVDITNQNLPMLATLPSTKSVATTKVFDIDMHEVDKVMDTIIQKHLNNDHPQ